jgi:hypothetical protein
VTLVKTGFEPARHGFKFRNRFHGGQVVSELAAQGRLQDQIGINLPKEVLALARGANFWGSFGLCGGMSWAALDLFSSGETPPADTRPPVGGTELFRKLVRRQADSMVKTELLRKVLIWQLLPDSSQWWGFLLDNVGNLVEKREWPRLQAALDARKPQSLCLIRSRGIGEIANNHQVVATGYETGPDGRVIVHIYDPNHPGTSPSLSFRRGGEGNRIDARQSTGEPLRGFFVWPHRSP